MPATPPPDSGPPAPPPPGRSWWRRHPWRSAAVLLVTVIGTALGVVLFTPALDPDLEAQPAPATSYAAAMELAGDLTGADDDAVNPLCRSQVLEHGERTERSVVLLHGFTNCPQQFSVIAQAYAEAGYSVVVPRLPGHGEADRLTTAPSDVGPAELAAAGDDAVDIAAGLGEEVTVVGLSGGGTLAGWLASERDEVAEAVLMAPLVAPRAIPEPLVAPVARAARSVPDIYLWWDGDRKEDLADPPYAYPRYSLRSLGAFLALGRNTQLSEPGRQNELDRLVVVVNENDAAVSNVGVYHVERQLEQLLPLDTEGVDRVDHVFPAEAGLKHDIVDPAGENADRLDEIYPVLGELLGLEQLSAP